MSEERKVPVAPVNCQTYWEENVLEEPSYRCPEEKGNVWKVGFFILLVVVGIIFFIVSTA